MHEALIDGWGRKMSTALYVSVETGVALTLLVKYLPDNDECELVCWHVAAVRWWEPLTWREYVAFH